MSPVEFYVLPEYKKLSNVVNKLSHLGTRPWGKTVTLKAMTTLCDNHLNQLVSAAIAENNPDRRAKLCRAGASLLNIVTALGKKVGTSEKWRDRENLAFRVLGAAHCLEILRQPEEQRLPIATRLTRDVTKIIFSKLDSLKNVRSVCRNWRRWADEISQTREHWVKVKSIKTKDLPSFAALFPNCKQLNLKKLKHKQVPLSLHLYPNLQSLKLPSYMTLHYHPEIFCPNLISLSVNDMPRFNSVDFSGFTKLKYITLKTEIEMFYSSTLPESIESITAKNVLMQRLIIPENARIKTLKLENCIGWQELDLTLPCFSELERLEILDNRSLHPRIHFPPSLQKLTHLEINGHGLDIDLENVSLPLLENLILKRLGDVNLPLPHLIPRLKRLILETVITDDTLDLGQHYMLEEVYLKDLVIESVSLPPSTEVLNIKSAELLTSLTFAAGSYELRYIKLSDVPLDFVDLSGFKKLETVKIDSNVECELILDENHYDHELSKNVSISNGARKKQKRRR